ncbi:N-acetylmuramoyl-L-alanine amidase [Streptococcus sp. DD13]|uniref:N-acetylmuramoyl-L-alanine amidase n=1 Tax=Streptococcus sp. DD13 TaxID=1777881 RepID=UPI0007914974|nr:N-acetylmuramoyl-L-alanine amidase [Streptococcus sp. DD13]KXT79158.1 N-acetylmuramoyl-L-alanine amidase [Streptococcus sp. DD13]
MKKIGSHKAYALYASLLLATIANAPAVLADQGTTDETSTPVSVTQTSKTETELDKVRTEARNSEGQSLAAPVTIAEEPVAVAPHTEKNTESASSESQTRSDSSQTTRQVPSSAERPVAQGQRVEEQKPVLTYSSHVQNIGWQKEVSEGQTSGTVGQSKRVEAIKIQVQSKDGGVRYQAHVQNIGWQDVVSNGQVAGTIGQSKQMEAFNLQLTGNLLVQYDLYYRAQIQNKGWLGWAKNGENAGSQGLGLRLEAYEVRLVKKGTSAGFSTNGAFLTNLPEKKDVRIPQPGVFYKAHVKNVGWQTAVSNGQVAGTVGESKQMEALVVSLTDVSHGTIEVKSHVQNIGWQNYVTGGKESGTTGKGLRVEALQMHLTGELAQHYRVAYRVHVQDIGWQDWVYEDQIAGTIGRSKQIEALQVQIVKKEEQLANTIPVVKPAQKGASASQGNYSVLNRVIYLDAGHGGKDPGAVANGLLEKNLNMAIQNKLKTQLERKGYKVVTTRTTDSFVDLLERSQAANKSRADIFISIHFNSGPASFEGIETYYYQAYAEYPSKINASYHVNPERMSRSDALAQAIHTHVVRQSGAKNRGVQRNTFSVLRETTAPAVLLELGYMSNSSEAKKMATSAYQDKLVAGILAGVDAYYKQYTL